MRKGLTATLRQLASWLQLASQAVPISQLSVMTWLIFAASGSVSSWNPFNIHEQ